MNVVMRLRPAGRVLWVALVALLLGAKVPMEVDGASWHFPSVLEKDSVKAGKFKEKGKDLIAYDLVFPGEGTMEVWSEGDKVAQGTHTRKSVKSRKLIGDLDAQSLHDLAEELRLLLEQELAGMGFDATVDLAVVKASLKMKLKPKVKQDLVWMTSRVKFQFKGTMEVDGKVFKVKAKQSFKGTSDPLPLSEVLLDEF